MVKLPSEIINCVGFIGSRNGDTVVLRGTAFFVVRRVPEIVEDISLCYAVTAKHVLVGIRNSGQQGCLRLTLKSGGTAWIDFSLDDWIEHQDTTVDAAIMRMNRVHTYDIGWITTSRALTPEVLAAEPIGVGTEVFMTGLFVNRPGRDKNVPIVRIGNISAMPEEKVSTPTFGDIEAYLVEARSIGGLSGSPAFAHLGVVKIVAATEPGGAARPVYASSHEGVFYWMGLVHGHYDGDLTVADQLIADASIVRRERVNMGIAIVVPATRILEIFDDVRFKLFEAMATEAAAQKYTRVKSTGEVAPPAVKVEHGTLMVREPSFREQVEAVVNELIQAEAKSNPET